MAAVAGTGTSLSASYYLRNFYTANRNAVTSSKRKEMTGGTLSQADATALHRAAKKLRNFNYEDDTTDSANIYGSVNAFIQVYNNTLSSGNKTDDASLNRYSWQQYRSDFIEKKTGARSMMNYHPLRVLVFSSLYIFHIDCNIIPLHADLCHASTDKRHHRWSVSDIHVHNDRHFEIF